MTRLTIGSPFSKAGLAAITTSPRSYPPQKRLFTTSSKSPFCRVFRMDPPDTPTTRTPKANSTTAASTEHTRACAHS